MSPTTTRHSTESIELPSPRLESPASIEQTLLGRHSVREYDRRPLTLEEVSQLLWAAQGVTRNWGARTAPSAGALFPLELYVATANGVVHYLPRAHRIESVVERDVRPALFRAGLQQDAIVDAPAVFVITAVVGRTAQRYGRRAQRYVLMEVGHAAQNLLLQADALGLGGVPIGAFRDDDVHEILGLASDEVPYYLIPVGAPASTR